ncbi:MAG: hypothetical protein PHD66_08285 [Eubacteriales bacterium]|nr:hypothetical protein [Eubacteriales bacterium]
MDKTKKLSENHINIIRLAITGLLAFIGTYFSTPGKGLISTLPILLISALLCVAVKIPSWQKIVFYALFGYFFTTVYYDSKAGMIFAAVCISILLLCELSVYLLKRKKILFAILAILLPLICILPQTYFFGNYIDGKEAQDRISEYVDKRYSDEEMTISGVNYDYKTKYYIATIYDKDLPTDVYTIASQGDHLHDGYLTFAEQTLMYNQMLEITKTLRADFENDRFDVSPQKIIGYPFSGKISLGDEADYRTLMTFKITVPGLLSKAEFEKRAREYYDTILRSGLEFNKICFVGNGTQTDIMTITVSNNPLIGNFSALTSPPRLYDGKTDIFLSSN